MFFEAVESARLELFERPTSLGDAYHRYIEVAVLHHCLQSRENLLGREIAGCTKENASEFVTVISLSGLGCTVGFLQVSAKLIAHRGQKLVSEVSLAP